MKIKTLTRRTQLQCTVIQFEYLWYRGEKINKLQTVEFSRKRFIDKKGFIVSKLIETNCQRGKTNMRYKGIISNACKTVDLLIIEKKIFEHKYFLTGTYGRSVLVTELSAFKISCRDVSSWIHHRY